MFSHGFHAKATTPFMYVKKVKGSEHFFTGTLNPALKNAEVDHVSISQEDSLYRIKLYNYSNLLIGYNFMDYPIYVWPGDTLKVFCNTTGCSFGGTRAAEWNLTPRLIADGFPFYGLSDWKFDSVPFDEYIESTLQQKSRLFATINSYQDSLQYSREYLALLKRDLECAYLKSFIANSYKYSKQSLKAQEQVSTYVKSYERFFLSDTLRNSFVFCYALMDWSAFLARAANGMQKPEKTKTYFEPSDYDFGENYLKRLEMALAMPEPNRTDLLFKLLSHRFSTDTWQGNEYQPYVDFFIEHGSNKHLVEKIKILSGAAYIPADSGLAARITSGEDILNSVMLDSDNQPVLWKDVLKRGGARLIYISFWASWCAPCIREFIDSRERVKKLAQANEIVFITISIDRDEEKWKKTLKYLRLEEDYQNYLMNSEGELARLFLPGGAVPGYAILDRNGTLKTLKAPGLSTTGGGVVIQTLLKER
jgi:thiol-disulfide isomerase/thioredoxin